MEFGYEIIRIWQRPAEELLAGPLGVAPLALLGTIRGKEQMELPEEP
jgi:hypothetical protein